jgi:hypothetical protein
MSSKNTSPLLSVRPRSVLASRPPSLRGEAFGSNAWSGHRVRQGYGSQLLVSLEWLHAAVPTPFVAKLRKPTVGLSANHHPMGGSRPMAFLGYPRGHRIDPETGCCMTAHRTPNERMDTLPRTRASPEPMGHYRGMKPGRPPEFCATLKLLALSVVPRRNVPPSSRLSKQWPRSFGLRSDAPSQASFPSPATPHRSRVTGPPHSWLGWQLP